MLAPHHIHRVAGIVQNLPDGANVFTIGIDFHTNQLCGKDHLIVDVLPVQRQHLAPKLLGSLHGVHTGKLYQIAGLLHPDGFHLIILSTNAAAVKLAKHFRSVQPAEHLHFTPDAMGIDDLTSFDKLEFHSILLYLIHHSGVSSPSVVIFSCS